MREPQTEGQVETSRSEDIAGISFVWLRVLRGDDLGSGSVCEKWPVSGHAFRSARKLSR